MITRNGDSRTKRRGYSPRPLRPTLNPHQEWLKEAVGVDWEWLCDQTQFMTALKQTRNNRGIMNGLRIALDLVRARK